VSGKSQRKGLFAETHCDEVVYRFTASSDKFNLDMFSGVVKDAAVPNGWTNVICPSGSDYHTHLAWMIKPKLETIRIQVGFHSGDPEEKEEKLKLHSEGCMSWLGQFFKNESAHAHVHADFEFPSGRKSRFPLPLKASIGSSPVDIDGVSFRLGDRRPSGATGAWVTQRKDELTVQLVVEKKVLFKGFSIADDIKGFLAVVDELTEETP
jgi:hypothetical protein